MNGFLFDEHLPAKIRFKPSYPIFHVSVLGSSPSDTQIWHYAKRESLVIVTKDADFSDRSMVESAPPTVVHLRFGNMRKKDFHAFLANVWSHIESLAIDNKLINVYLDRIEVIRR